MTYTDEEIIKALDTCSDESEDCANCPFRIDIDSCNRLTKIAIELIKRQRAELEKRQWISVDDRLPSEQDADDIGMVLAVHKTSKKRYYHWRIVVDNPFDFTNWMPIPVPPKGD